MSKIKFDSLKHFFDEIDNNYEKKYNPQYIQADQKVNKDSIGKPVK